ncbi:nuclear RNA export factor 3 [Mastomys coucha]|uniref:nuclear RNA export factor 3 n=1 Tax=Mastomys coucha TaxID=35658 RepID=UPI0012623CB6|nr:nuclear RNA export factor 3 [Mastomys coucha]
MVTASHLPRSGSTLKYFNVFYTAHRFIFGSKTNPIQRRMRCQRIFRRSILNSTEHTGDTVHTSSYKQQYGEPAMSNSLMHTRRYTPYGMPSRHQRVNLHKWNQMSVNMEGGSQPPERKIERDKQDDTSENWFKVTIPFGIQYDKKWLLNLFQSQCHIPFTPVQFHYEKMQAHFFVNNPNVAFMLKAISDKIRDETDNKISVFISPCDEPPSVTELKLEKMDHKKPQSHRTPSVILQPTMKQQCATSQRVLSRQRLPFDQDLMTHPTDLALIPRSYMAHSLTIQEKNMTQMNSEGEMVKEQAPDPEKICADKSFLSTTMPDKSSNINSILELFPKLLSLDGQESRKPTLCGPEDHKTLPTCKGSFFGSESIKTMVLQFLQQYFFIYDNGDRQGLLHTYHAEACFSLTVPFSSVDLCTSSLCEYFKYSRNMKILKDPLDGSSQGCVHAFTRIFIATCGNSSDLCIINDKLSVRNAHGVPSASTSVVTSSSSYLPSFSQDLWEMVPTFSAQSRENVERSQKCPQGDQRNYNRAIQSLALLKVKDTVPEDKFTQTDTRSQE